MRLKTNLNVICNVLKHDEEEITLAFHQTAFRMIRFIRLVIEVMEKAGNKTYSQNRGELDWSKYNRKYVVNIKKRNPIPRTCWETTY